MSENQELKEALKQCIQAFELTRQYVGYATLPPLPGWSWFDAVKRASAALGIEMEVTGMEECESIVPSQVRNKFHRCRYANHLEFRFAFTGQDVELERFISDVHGLFVPELSSYNNNGNGIPNFLVVPAKHAKELIDVWERMSNDQRRMV